MLRARALDPWRASTRFVAAYTLLTLPLATLPGAHRSSTTGCTKSGIGALAFLGALAALAVAACARAIFRGRDRLRSRLRRLRGRAPELSGGARRRRVALAQLSPGARVLEVGSGTGQATRLFAARGLPSPPSRPAPSLAAATRANVPAADVVHGRFEDAPLPRAASRSSTRRPRGTGSIRRSATPAPTTLLVPGGALALFWNEHVRGDDDVGFFDATQDLYEARRHGARSASSRGRSAAIARPTSSPAATSATSCAIALPAGTPSTTRESYARLVGTYSDHLRLPADVRTRLLDGIAALIDARFGGRIVKHYVADLYVARARTRDITPA